jgi:Tol biopolymer transport system component
MKNRFTVSILAVLASFPAGPVCADGGSEEARFLTKSRQLVYEGKRSGEGYFSPDGKRMIFQSEREEGNPFYQIYSLDMESGDVVRISTGKGKTTCGFFQGASGRVLFSSTHHDGRTEEIQKAELEFRASGKTRRYAWDYDPSFEIYSAGGDGTGVQRLTNSEGYDAEASYSPDGKLIVFSSNRAYFASKPTDEDRARFEKDPAYYLDLYVMNADGSGVRRLTDAPGYDGGPFFSPDGTRIVWRRFDASGMNADIYTMRLDGSDVRRVTDFGAMSWAPYFHPSGEYLIFTCNKHGFGNFELFVVDVDGRKEPVRVTFTDGFDGLPVFLPDGGRLSWSSARGGSGTQIYLADWNHAAAREALAGAPARGGAPVGAAETLPKGEGAKASGVLGAGGASKGGAEILRTDIAEQIRWMADPAREGRKTGTTGARATAEWISSYFASNGLKAFEGGYLRGFDFPAGVEAKGEGNVVRLKVGEKEESLEFGKEFRPLGFSDSGEVEGELVFGGYGLSAPEGAGGKFGYNSFEGMDLKGKVVLCLRYVPEGVDAERRQHLNRYAGVRYKAMLARERGAKAVLFVAGPNSANAGELMALTDDSSVSGSGIIAASVSGGAAERLVASTGKTLKELQTALDSENPHVEPAFPVKGVRVSVKSSVTHRRGSDANVVGYLPAGSGDTKEWVVIGAHYDHLGRGGGSNSMAKAGEETAVHPGADDNASGTAVMLELAAYLAAEREKKPGMFKRGVIFAGWSGEEIGLLGSASFVERPPVEVGGMVAYLNFDMVGRLRDNKLTLQGIGSSSQWRRLIEKRNIAAGFQLSLQNDPYLPTDTTSFYPKRIPVLNFFTGSHEDYHRPQDTADKIDVEGVERIGRFASALVMDVVGAAEKIPYERVERSSENAGNRETLRAYVGTIPDYGTEVKGVKITGVRAGSPAEKGGLKGGDVIVGFGAAKVANIYDYTYALDAVKIGQKVEVRVMRGDKEIALQVVPEARK